MSTRRRRATTRVTAAPFLDLMIKSGEIATASAMTIFHRTLMMSGADTSALTAAERREFARMYTEKMQAAMESGQIIAAEMLRLNQQLMTLAWSQSVSNAMALTSMLSGHNPGSAFAAQTQFMNTAARQVAESGQKIVAATTRAATRGLTPIHTAASANARRLGRPKR
ncbi:MAG: phasin family protein [Gammaproteobacteria bacterium]